MLDIRYIRDFGDGLEGAVKQNRTEMFADIGGVIEGIRSGADLTLAEKAAAVRATWSFLTGPSHAKTPPESDQRFQSIVYATEEGLDALKARIEKTMGVESFANSTASNCARSTMKSRTPIVCPMGRPRPFRPITRRAERRPRPCPLLPG